MDKKDKFLVGLCIFLSAGSLVGVIRTLILRFNVMSVAHVVVLLAVIYYALVGYKKPHGNKLRYLIILFAVSLLFDINLVLQAYVKRIGTFGPTQQTIILLYLVSLMIVVYVAGRLNKVKQNAVLMPLALLMLLGIAFHTVLSYGNGGFIAGLLRFNITPIIWFDICFAYFLRYKEHKDAGLE